MILAHVTVYLFAAVLVLLTARASTRKPRTPAGEAENRKRALKAAQEVLDG